MCNWDFPFVYKSESVKLKNDSSDSFVIRFVSMVNTISIELV